MRVYPSYDYMAGYYAYGSQDISSCSSVSRNLSFPYSLLQVIMDREALHLVARYMNILLVSDDCIQIVYRKNVVIPLLLHLSYPGLCWAIDIIHTVGSGHGNHWLAVSVAVIRSCIINIP